MDIDEIVLRAIPIPPDMCRINRQMAEKRRVDLKERIIDLINEKLLSLTPKSENEATDLAREGDSAT